MRQTLYNQDTTVEALQENVAIAAAHLTNEKGLVIQSPITIKQALQIGQHLWNMGYRRTGEEVVMKIQL